MYAKGSERKHRRQVEEDTQAGAVATFQAYGRTLEAVSSFKYLRRVLTVSTNYWPAVVSNLRKAWRKWARFSSFLGQEGEDSHTHGMFYKSIVQATLLFGL